MAKTVSAPMEALLAAELPEGEGWQYEPKWDGFRCLARRDGDEITLTSKSGKPLARYFPEVVEMLRGTKERRFLLDGELIIPLGDILSFDALQLRLHPAESRIRKLSKETPAELMAFDLLELGGDSFAERPLGKRRKALEKFFEKNEVPGRRARDDQSEAAAHGRLRGRWLPLRRKETRSRFAPARPLRRRGTPRPCRLHFGHSLQGAARADQEARSANPAAGLHRQRARRAQPLEHRAHRPVGAAEARARRRGPLRPGDGPALPPRHRLPPLAAGQGPEAVHFRPARARASPLGTRGAIRGMTLLFDAPVIPGLKYADDVIDDREEAGLIEQLGELDLAPFRFHGWLGNRRTKSFGWRYDFDDASFSRTEPIPDWLDPVRRKAARFAGIGADDFVHVLLARYDPGAGIGWHRDRDVFDRVVGISLNTRATLRFRQRTGSGFRRASIDVAPHSAYLLSGEARYDWEHRIQPGDELRFSITFRTLSDKGRHIAAQS